MSWPLEKHVVSAADKIIERLLFMENNLKELWERTATDTRGVVWYPNEFVIRFLAKYVRKRVGIDEYRVIHEITRALDLGCGHGRHVIMLAEQGYDVAGIDISDVAIGVARDWVAKKGLKADLRTGTVTALPYSDSVFDLVMSHGVLDHIYYDESREAVREIHRVLKPNGLLYVDLISALESGCGQGREVGRRTYIVPDGAEAGVPQRFFELEDVMDLLRDHFTIQDVVLSQWEPVFGEGFSNLDKENGRYPRAARYHVAAIRK
ncbi:MAG: class I SAM-dependent methyltransferase [Nitrospirae bacterium]|nr:MAG: class I SAM-dependent methyltransferase [Nitrospirota bacterium]